MGAESGGGGRGDASPRREISGGRPPRNEDISVTFSRHVVKFCIFQPSQNKEAEIRGENKFLGKVGLGAHESVPQRKFRGGAPGGWCRALPKKYKVTPLPVHPYQLMEHPW